MTEIVWGWPLALEVFLVGLASAGIIIAFLVDLFWRDKYESIARCGNYIAPIALIVAIVLLIYHLGSTYRAPWNVVYAFTNFESALALRSMAISILTGFSIILALSWLFEAPRRFRLVVNGIAAAIGLYVAVNGGIVFALCRGEPFWNSSVLPWIFTVGSFPAALAAIGLTIPITAQLFPRLFRGVRTAFESPDYKDILLNISTTNVLLLIATAILTVIYLLLSAGTAGYSILVSGAMATLFWAYVVVGTIIPLCIWILAKYFGWATGKTNWAQYVSYALILVGIMALTFGIIYAGQL